jgi:branched-chain amino acid transport system permease protein
MMAEGEIFGLSLQLLIGMVIIGLLNGAFYALLSLGLALIFGMLGIVNFAHGALYALGAFTVWWLSNMLGLGFWWALLLAPLAVGLLGMAIERVFLKRLAGADPLYGLLLTFGLALVIEGALREGYGVSGLPYNIPAALIGGIDLGVLFLPTYRSFVVVAALVVCLGVWLLIERTRLGARLRAATENPELVRAFGINVPLMVTLAFGLGAALAALAGVLAAPIYSVNPLMGSHLIIVVFAVVVIGGLGSIPGAIISGFGLGVVEGLTRLVYPEAADVVIFVVMALVLLARPAGLFGRRA